MASAVNSSDLIYDASCKVKEFGLNREPKTDKINSSKMTADRKVAAGPPWAPHSPV